MNRRDQARRIKASNKVLSDVPLEILEERLAKMSPDQSSQSSAKSDDLKGFYQLGLNAYRMGWSVQDAIKQVSIWRVLESASDAEEKYFSIGIVGQKMPPIPQAVESKPPPSPKPLQGHVEILKSPEPIETQNASDPQWYKDMEQELNLLKTLVKLLEQKLAQPVIIKLNTPKLKSSQDIVERDQQDNIRGKKTVYEYEADKR